MKKRWFVFIFFLMIIVMGNVKGSWGNQKHEEIVCIKNARIINQSIAGDETMEVIIELAEESTGEMQYQILYEDNNGELFPYGEEWINGWSKPIIGDSIVKIEMKNGERNNEKRYLLRVRRCGYSGINEGEYGSFDQEVDLKGAEYLMCSISPEYEEVAVTCMGRTTLSKDESLRIKVYDNDVWSNLKLRGEDGIITKARSSEQEKLLRAILKSKENRENVMKKAVRLNGGDINNTCVYYLSGMLRNIGMKVPYGICNTGSIRWGGGLTQYLRNRGWKYSKDMKSLKPGDICFTTPKGGGEGKPTHAYTFLGWIDEDYRYALICDNQRLGYGGHIHIRNINFATKDKEAFYYYMYKNK